MGGGRCWSLWAGNQFTGGQQKRHLATRSNAHTHWFTTLTHTRMNVNSNNNNSNCGSSNNINNNNRVTQETKNETETLNITVRNETKRTTQGTGLLGWTTDLTMLDITFLLRLFNSFYVTSKWITHTPCGQNVLHIRHGVNKLLIRSVDPFHRKYLLKHFPSPKSTLTLFLF